MTLHLLIVEDDEFVLSLLGAYLQSGGFKVSLASSGREMLAMLDKDPVNLVLLDLSLPDEDGLALLRQVRARSSVPLIVLTGRKANDDRITALELGADDYLTKPCDPREISLRIQNLLDRAGAGDSTGDPREHRDVLHFNDWTLDVSGHAMLNPDGEDVPLTPA